MAEQKTELESLIEEISSEIGIKIKERRSTMRGVSYVREGEKKRVFLHYKRYSRRNQKGTLVMTRMLKVSLEGPGCGYKMVIKIPFQNIEDYLYLVKLKDRREVLKFKKNGRVYYRKQKQLEDLEGVKQQIYKLLGIEIEKW